MKTRNFNEVYEKLAKGKNPVIDSLQRRKQLFGILFLVLVLAFFPTYHLIMNNKAIVIAYVIIAIIVLFMYIISSGKYSSLYKETVINSLVKAYSEELSYNSRYGVSRMEYDASRFPGYYDRFHSEDLIQGNIDNEFSIKMSEIHLEKEETERDSDGNLKTSYTTVFRGLYGFVNITSLMMPYFYVSSNRIFGKYNSNRIEVDSAEFEKYYDLYTDDKIRTMEVFTSDLIEEFNKLKENLKHSVEVKVHNGRLFFRISMNDSFEAPKFKKSLDFDLMYNNFKIIDNPIRLISKIIENAKYVE